MGFRGKFSFVKLKQRLSFKFFLSVMAFSVLLTFLSTALQLFLQSRTDTAIIKRNVEFVGESYLPSIAGSLFELDENQLRPLLKGVLQLQGVVYCEVVEESQRRSYRISEGNSTSRKDIVREFPLDYQDRGGKWVSMGILRVGASSKSVYDRLWARAWVDIVSGAMQIFLIAFVALAIFQRMVVRHLTTIDAYTRRLDIDKLDPFLDLDRTPRQDELGRLADAINDLQHRFKQDITRRDRAEKALREREKQLKLVLAGAELGMWDWNVQTGKFVINERGLEILGCKVDEIRYDLDTWKQLIHPDDMPGVRDVLNAHLEGKTPYYETEHRLRCKSGEWVWVLDRGKVIERDAERRPLRACGTYLDITERKRAEEALRAAEKEIHWHAENLEKIVEARTEQIQKLERERMEAEKLAATGRMAGRIAHEINNPLAGIKNSFRLLKDAIPVNYPYLKYVGLIDKEMDRIARIVSQMYDLYRPEKEATREFSVNESILEVKSLLDVSEGRLRKSNITIEVETGDKPIVVTMKESIFHQILYNLLDNAIDASPPGEAVRVTASVTKDALSITVSDHGIGIPEELRSKIFEPFLTTKELPDKRALGIGLSISKSLVEELGGAIDFTSEVGKGTVFRVTLPISL